MKTKKNSPESRLFFLVFVYIIFSQRDSSWTGRYSVRSQLPVPMQMPMRFPGLRGLLPLRLRSSVALAVIHTNSRTYKCLEHQSNGRAYSEDGTEETYYRNDQHT